MLPLVLVALLTGASPEPVRLAATSFQFVNIAPELATFCSEHFAQQLTLEGIRVTTPNEISTMLGFERQKELMGCTDKSTSCLAELANALGVDGLITGTVGRFGKSYQVNIKILSAADARPVVAHSGRVKGEEDLIDEYTRAAAKLAPLLIAKMRKAPAAPPPDAPVAVAPQPAPTVAPAAPAAAPPVAEVTSTAAVSPLRRWFWVPAAAGLVSAGVGTALLISARGKSAALTGEGKADGVADTTLTPSQARELAGAGQTEQTVGAVLVTVGGAAVAGGAAMFVLGGMAVQPSVALTPTGAHVAVAGAF